MSIMALVFRFQVHRSEADATYLLGNTFIVTYVRTCLISPQKPR